jgi:hypothetical protein
VSYLDGPPPSVTRYRSGDGETSRPDFVLVGLPVPGGVELWASTELTEVELEAEIRFRPYAFEELLGRADYPPPTRAGTRYTLKAGLRKYVIVRAPTYRQALGLLLQHPGWEPGGGPLAIGLGSGAWARTRCRRARAVSGSRFSRGARRTAGCGPAGRAGGSAAGRRPGGARTR